MARYKSRNVERHLPCCRSDARLRTIHPGGLASLNGENDKSRRSADGDYHQPPVNEHSRQEVARKAGVDPAYVEGLVELGILKPGPGDTFSTGDVRRALWVHSLEQAGVPLEGMAAAVRDGAL